MSVADLSGAASRRATTVVKTGPNRIVSFAVGLAAALALLYLAQQVIEAGYMRRDIQALETGDAWKRGGWLSQVVLVLVSYIPDRAIRQTALSLFGAGAAGAVLGVLYHRFRANGWFVVGALLLVAAIAAHALQLYLATAGSRAIPLLVAMAALIPAIRSFEDVGDVQSAISLGLTLPLLLLASPTLTPLILPLAIIAALADPDGRRDPRAFIAMILVAVLPTLIVCVGIVGFAAQAGFDIANLLLPYAAAFRSFQLGDWWSYLGDLGRFAPMLVVPLLYCVLPGIGERRRVWSALAVVGLPLYLAIGASVFPWTMPAWIPPLTMLATYGSWLAVARLSLWMRILALAFLLAALVLSWQSVALLQDRPWQDALTTILPKLG